MKKIPSVFQRNYEGDHLIRNEVVPGCEWVMDGLGISTRKYDGTCCLIRDGKLFKRYELKKGRIPLPHFEPAQDADPTTGGTPGWLPIGETNDDRWHREAFAFGEDAYGQLFLDGTYELCGPKVQGNPEAFSRHMLVRHGGVYCWECPQPPTFESIRDYLARTNIEGIVWHHPDGRMAKIKQRDYGLKRQGTTE